MEVYTLRETKDNNLNKIIRLKQKQNGNVYFAVLGEGVAKKDVRCLEKPIFIHIRVTNKCNLKCPYCYTQDNNLKKDMSDDEIKSLINICDKEGALNITWTGGEPFARKKMCEFINIAYKMGINQTVLTNGTLLTADILKSLPTDNITLQISLNEIWSNDISIGKRQISILQNISRAINSGFNIVITVIFEPVEITRYECLIETLISYKIPIVRFGFEVPVGGLSQKDMYTYISDMKKMFLQLNKLKEKYINDIVIIYQFDKYCVDETLFPKRFLSCEAGTTQIYIDNNGDVYPCPLFKSYNEFLCGNVLCNSWEELWNSKPMESFRNVSICENCEVLCTDWCRALLYPLNKSLEGKSVYCLKTIE